MAKKYFRKKTYRKAKITKKQKKHNKAYVDHMKEAGKFFDYVKKQYDQEEIKDE